MHYGLPCPNEECGKVAFRLRPGIRPEDIASAPLDMGLFVGTHPLSQIRCPHCERDFQPSEFTAKNIVPLG
jgi:hypothetical protein